MNGNSHLLSRQPPWLTKPARATIAGLAVGYVFFGLLFTMHIHTHGYYHAQLIPLVGLAMSPLAALVVRRALDSQRIWLKVGPPLAVTAFLAILGIQEVRAGLNRARYEDPETSRRVGQLVGHSTRVAFISRHYGSALQYFGELTGSSWPRPSTWYLHPEPNQQELSVDERLQALPFVPEYFVITDFSEFQRHHSDLAAYLTAQCLLKEKADAYLVYEGCRRSARG